MVAAERQVRVLYAGQGVACHAQNSGRRVTVIERAHLAGIVGSNLVGVSWLTRPSTDVSLVALPAAVHAQVGNLPHPARQVGLQVFRRSEAIPGSTPGACHSQAELG
ncbi:hypothetical protein [Variovorax sp. MHTC-1]|uniref:hypothetical protein n=1 Tax=Variovorax sp. MHTC-1 TaxID=2495593 RepID=UPI000F888F2C|nr:hypothetical protein [Variovorax sp. MHTC-1]RST47898.1 hypothetical protein EJI01_27480 [Variovorax sp. MHTC-1]